MEPNPGDWPKVELAKLNPEPLVLVAPNAGACPELAEELPNTGTVDGPKVAADWPPNTEVDVVDVPPNTEPEDAEGWPNRPPEDPPKADVLEDVDPNSPPLLGVEEGVPNAPVLVVAVAPNPDTGVPLEVCAPNMEPELVVAAPKTEPVLELSAWPPNTEGVEGVEEVVSPKTDPPAVEGVCVPKNEGLVDAAVLAGCTPPNTELELLAAGGPPNMEVEVVLAGVAPNSEGVVDCPPNTDVVAAVVVVVVLLVVLAGWLANNPIVVVPEAPKTLDVVVGTEVTAVDPTVEVAARVTAADVLAAPPNTLLDGLTTPGDSLLLLDDANEKLDSAVVAVVVAAAVDVLDAAVAASSSSEATSWLSMLRAALMGLLGATTASLSAASLPSAAALLLSASPLPAEDAALDAAAAMLEDTEAPIVSITLGLAPPLVKPAGNAGPLLVLSELGLDPNVVPAAEPPGTAVEPKGVLVLEAVPNVKLEVLLVPDAATKVNPPWVDADVVFVLKLKPDPPELLLRPLKRPLDLGGPVSRAANKMLIRQQKICDSISTS